MKTITSFLLLIISAHSFAQQKQLAAFAPGRNEMLKRYQAADDRDSLVRRTVFKSNVLPTWTGPSAFWYRNLLADSAVEYMYVDAARNIKKKLFDAELMAKALAVATGKPVAARSLSISKIFIYPGEQKLAIAAGITNYLVSLPDYHLTKTDSVPSDKTVYPSLTLPASRWQRPRSERLSPDKSQQAIVRDFNIFLQPADTTLPAVALTTDGTQSLPWGDLSWSPDGRFIIAYKESVSSTNRFTTFSLLCQALRVDNYSNRIINNPAMNFLPTRCTC